MVKVSFIHYVFIARFIFLSDSNTLWITYYALSAGKALHFWSVFLRNAKKVFHLKLLYLLTRKNFKFLFNLWTLKVLMDVEIMFVDNNKLNIVLLLQLNPIIRFADKNTKWNIFKKNILTNVRKHTFIAMQVVQA
jgi:hypothetical protein